MNGKLVGRVTENEKIEIEKLFNKKNAIQELLMSMQSQLLSDTAEKNELYDRLIKDMTEVKGKFDKWWHDMSKKYKWESELNKMWSINFETNDIILVDIK